MSIDILSELRTMARATTGFAVRRLMALGVKRDTIADMGRHHYSFGVCKCMDLDDGMFCPDSEGRIRLVLPIYEDGELVDLVSLTTDRPHDTRLRTGDGWALGLERGLDQYRWDEPLILHGSPLDWLRADCQGLCVVDWSSPEVNKLRDFDQIRCADPRLKPLLFAALSRPARLPKIIDLEGYQDAA